VGALLRTSGVTHALLSAGGSSVFALDGRGSGWPVEVRPAGVKGGPLARLRLHEGGLGTSGAGEQFVEVEGRRYGHVLDPRSGWPSSGVFSASVACADPAAADALSTAFFVGGTALAERYCREHRDTLALVTPDDGSERPQVFGSFSGVTLEGR